MNKKAGMSTKEVLLMFGILAVIGVAVWAIFGLQEETPSASIGGTALTETGPTSATAIVSCPSDGSTDGQIRYEDTLASTNTYGNPTCYFDAKTSGLERVTAGTLQTDGSYSTAVDLKCVESGTKWRTTCVTKIDAYHSSVEDSDFVAEGTYVKRDLLGKAFGTLMFKVEDKYTGGASYFNISGCGTETSGSYNNFNGSKCQIKNNAATGTSLTLGTDGYIDARIYIKTNETKKQFGEDGLRTWFLVDADGSTWDEPIVYRDGGAKLVNKITELQPEDKRYYSGYESAFEIGSIGDRESTIDFYLESASGVNPGTSVDPTWDICSEGRYNSNKQTDTILVGCWTDAATQVGVSTSLRHYAYFNVS